MASNYKRLGNYIQQVDVRNTDLSVELLLGVSIEKKFIDSHANTIGTDFSKYKIVKRGQFAYGPVTSRNGDKVSIALLEDADACLISSSYIPFEIIKPEELNAEFLMILFRNPEFDRYARYNSWGSAREVFSWDDFCESELYIPSIEEQQKIVRIYKTITDRISLLNKLNEVLCNLAILEIKNRSNNSDKVLIKDFCSDTSSGGTPKRSNLTYYGGNINWLKSGEVHNNIIYEVEEKISEEGLLNSSAKIFPKDTVLMAMYGATAGQVGYLNIESSTNQAICAMFCKDKLDAAFLYFSLIIRQKEFERQVTGGAQENLSQEVIRNNYINVPDKHKTLHSDLIMSNIIVNSNEIGCLEKLKKQLIVRL